MINMITIGNVLLFTTFLEIDSETFQSVIIETSNHLKKRYQTSYVHSYTLKKLND